MSNNPLVPLDRACLQVFYESDYHKGVNVQTGKFTFIGQAIPFREGVLIYLPGVQLDKLEGY